jgi:RNA-directed DNA polymerase
LDAWVVSERFAKFGLGLHPDKTRLIEFGRFADQERRRRGEGKPEIFDFLGFTHICGKQWKNGRFTVLRQTMRTRLQAKLHEVKAELRRRMHHPIREQGAWLRSVVGGHMRYYGVPRNTQALSIFRFEVTRRWWRTLRRRSQRHPLSWERMRRHTDRWLPPARVYHPYPSQRLAVRT